MSTLPESVPEKKKKPLKKKVSRALSKSLLKRFYNHLNQSEGIIITNIDKVIFDFVHTKT